MNNSRLIRRSLNGSQQGSRVNRVVLFGKPFAIGFVVCGIVLNGLGDGTTLNHRTGAQNATNNQQREANRGRKELSHVRFLLCERLSESI